MTIKQLHHNWLRASANFTNAHQQLEEELTRMRERKVAQEYIDKKDLQIELLVTFFNDTDELLQAYKLALTNARLENHILTDMVKSHLSIKEVLDYQPSVKPQATTQSTSVNG
jgi:hypothetical protein